MAAIVPPRTGCAAPSVHVIGVVISPVTGTSCITDYAIELPLFRRSVAADATIPDVRFSPVHRIGAGSGTALLILAAVPPSAGEYRFVRVATVLILLGHTLVLILCWFSRV